MPPTRYRCTSCGNLTRFDVTTTRRTRAFHHYTVGGQLEVEEVEVLAEAVEEVSCRWCGSGQAIIELTDTELESDSDSDAELGSVPTAGEPQPADGGGRPG